MFDPALWKNTKPAVITLVSLGALLVVPALFVFLLVGFALSEGLMSHVFEESQGVVLFITAVGASGAGTLAWGALVFLLAFQRRSIRAHLVTWPVVSVAGVACLFGSLVWISQIGTGANTGPFSVILAAVLILAPVLILVGVQNFRRAAAAKRAWLAGDGRELTPS